MKRALLLIIVVALTGCAAKEPYEKNNFHAFISKHKDEQHKNSYRVAQGFCVHFANDFDTFNRCMDEQFICYQNVEKVHATIMREKGALYTASMIDRYYRSREAFVKRVKGINHCDLYVFLKKHLDTHKGE